MCVLDAVGIFLGSSLRFQTHYLTDLNRLAMSVRYMYLTKQVSYQTGWGDVCTTVQRQLATRPVCPTAGHMWPAR